MHLKSSAAETKSVSTYLQVLSINRTLQSTYLTICERQETNNQYRYEIP
jgi:hypothetical protein